MSKIKWGAGRGEGTERRQSEVSEGLIMQGLTGHGKNFGFCSEELESN